MLTPKQEKYVQNLIKGMSQREAYKKSYNAKNMQNDTIDKKASALLKQEKIRSRYDELVKKAEDKAIMSAIERKKWLTKVISGETKEKMLVGIKEKEDGTSEIIERDVSTKLKTRMMALDMLNKMDGEYKTILEGKVDIVKLEDVL